jgi:lipid A disaccharide synthetase
LFDNAYPKPLLFIAYGGSIALSLSPLLILFFIYKRKIEPVVFPKPEIQFPLELGEFKELLKPLRLLAKTVYLDSEPQRGYEILANARFGWIKSGTTAFETALLGTPHLMYYRVNLLTYLIAKKLVKIPYLHLANLVLDEEVVPELVQIRFTPKRLLKETYLLLEKEEYQKTRFEELKELLKPPEGSVFENVARILEEVGKGKL